MRGARAWSILLVVLVGIALIRLMLFRGLDGSLVWGWNPEVSGLRAQAVISACVAGASLALAGLLLQGMLRNPLASPFVLGLSTGSQAAVAVSLLIAWKAGIPMPPGLEIPVATLGAAAALLACIAFGVQRGRGLDPVSLVLAGVVVASIAGSLATLCEWMLPAGDRGSLLAWSLGRIPENPDRATLLVAAAGALVVGLSAWMGGLRLDAMQLSDDEARAVGVSLPAARLAVVVASSLLAAVATALCGPLAFVGLVAPHAARAMVGGSHGRSVPVAMAAGAALLMLADVTRLLVPIEGGGRLPVGVVCALAGGPAFLILLRRGAARSWSS
jgi:iron complex transport system permease protein